MAYVSWETKRQAAAKMRSADAQMVGALSSMRPGQAPSADLVSDLPGVGSQQPQPPVNTAAMGSSASPSPGLSPGMQHTLDLAKKAGSAPMGADFAKNLGLDGYQPQPVSPTIGISSLLEEPKQYKKGGMIEGPPPPAPNVDNIPIMTQAEEYVMPRAVTAIPGAVEFFDNLVAAVTGEKPTPGGKPVKEDGTTGYEDGGFIERFRNRGDKIDAAVDSASGKAPPQKIVTSASGQAQKPQEPAYTPEPGGFDRKAFMDSIYNVKEPPRGYAGAGLVIKPDETYGLESSGGYPLTRSGSQQSRMLNDQGMNNTLALTPGAFRDAQTLYKAEPGKVDTRKTGIPQVPSNVTTLARHGIDMTPVKRANEMLQETVTGKPVRQPGAPWFMPQEPESVLSPSPRMQEASKPQQKQSVAQGAPAVKAAPTAAQPTEQDLLDRLEAPGASLTRDGKIFRYEDPAAKRPGRAPQAQPRVIRGRGGVEIPRDSRPVVNGWLAGPATAGAIMREARAYDHLPISGVTYSDSIGGTALGQVRPLRADPQAMAELDRIYAQDADRRGAEKLAMGLDARPEQMNRPAISQAQAASQSSILRGLDAIRPQEQAMDLAEMEAMGKRKPEKPVDNLKAVGELWRTYNPPDQTAGADPAASARNMRIQNLGMQAAMTLSQKGFSPQYTVPTVIQLLAQAQAKTDAEGSEKLSEDQYLEMVQNNLEALWAQTQQQAAAR